MDLNRLITGPLLARQQQPLADLDFTNRTAEIGREDQPCYLGAKLKMLSIQFEIETWQKVCQTRTFLHMYYKARISSFFYLCLCWMVKWKLSKLEERE